MLTYQLTKTGSESLYMHLYQCMKQDILDGTLPPDSKLPSKRSFAKNLGISVITVENAYAQLAAEGYIYSLPKRGFYVAKITPVKVKVTPKEFASMTKAPSIRYLADFTGNQTRQENFPFSIWSKLVREVLNDKQQELMTTPPCGGLLELRKAIAHHLQDFRNMQVEPNQIIIGAGTEYLYSLLIQLLGHDKIYAAENPGYQKIHQVYSHNQVRCVSIPMDTMGLPVSALEEHHVDIIHLSPAHHFPTGIVMPISRRYELLAWASGKDTRYIIEDEYDSEFRLAGRPIPTMQSIDVCEKVIYMNTFTKSLASTVRISYMVLPPHLVQQFYDNLSFYSCTVSNFEQYTLSRFIDDGYFEKHINRMRNLYHQTRDTLIDSIKKSPLSSYVTIGEEYGGLHFLITIRTADSDEAFCRRAREKGIRISSLSTYYHDTAESNAVIPEHIFIMNYSSIDPKVIPQAIEKLYECL